MPKPRISVSRKSSQSLLDRARFNENYRSSQGTVAFEVYQLGMLPPEPEQDNNVLEGADRVLDGLNVVTT